MKKICYLSFIVIILTAIVILGSGCCCLKPNIPCVPIL